MYKDNSKGHLLVIRLSAMGDVAISVPVIAAFCKQYPEVSLTIVTRPLFAPMFAQLPNCRVFPVDLKGKHKGIKGLYRLFKELRKGRKITAVADLHNVLRTNILKGFFAFTSIPFKQIDKGRKEKKKLTQAKNKIFVPLAPSYERYAKVFAALGFPLTLSPTSLVTLPPLTEKLRILLADETNIGIAPFASHKGKEYPFERMAQAIKALSERYPKAQIFIFGGGEREKTLVEALPAMDNVRNMIGQLSFAEELALIAHLQLMIAMDSGNAHLAAMYGVKVLTIWGITHPYAGFYPYGQPSDYALLADRKLYPLIPTSIFGNKYPTGYEKALETISPAEILEKAGWILGK